MFCFSGQSTIHDLLSRMQILNSFAKICSKDNYFYHHGFAQNTQKNQKGGETDEDPRFVSSPIVKLKKTDSYD